MSLPFIRPKPSIIDVRLFGAKGDGINDDTPAFMAACNALPEGGTIFVPTAPVAYRITRSGLNPPNTGGTGIYLTRSNLRILGEGFGSYLFGDNVANMIWIDGDNNTVEGLRLDSRMTTNAVGVPLCMGGNNVTVRNNMFVNTSTIARLTPRTAAAFAANNLTNSRFIHNTTVECQVSICGLGHSAHGILIQGNHFIRPHEMGVSVVGGTDTPTAITDIQILDNYIEDPSNVAIYVGSDGQGSGDLEISRILIARNICRGRWSNGGIFVRRGTLTEDIKIVDNLINGDIQDTLRGTYGVVLSEGLGADVCRGVTISGNTIKGLSANSIYVRAAPSFGLTISGNHLQSSGEDTSGMTITAIGDSQAIDISDNTVEHINSYAIRLNAGDYSMRGKISRNTFSSNHLSGTSVVRLESSSLGAVDLRIVDNTLGDLAQDVSDMAAINWSRCGSTPFLTILDNDFRPYVTPDRRFSPAPHSSWTIR